MQFQRIFHCTPPSSVVVVLKGGLELLKYDGNTVKAWVGMASGECYGQTWHVSARTVTAVGDRRDFGPLSFIVSKGAYAYLDLEMALGTCTVRIDFGKKAVYHLSIEAMLHD